MTHFMSLKCDSVSPVEARAICLNNICVGTPVLNGLILQQNTKNYTCKAEVSNM
jgi:hypothetical protein